MDKTYSRTTLIATCVIIGVLAFLGGMWLKDGSVDNESEASPSSSVTPYRTATPTATSSPKAVLHSIRLTDAGPSPKTLIVKVGDAVSFTNDTSRQIWPVSSECSGFDARRGLNTGEVYSLVFTAKGTCQYHNYLSTYNTIDSGTIIVQ